MSVISPIIGHERAQSQLVELTAQAKLPHAMIFSGPKGIGKAALAETLARCLLTESSTSLRAEAEPERGNLFEEDEMETPRNDIKLSYDSSHPAIARIEAEAHGNLKRVEPLRDEKKKMSFTMISIEQIREVIEFMHLSTAEAGWRVVLIDPADGMNRNAENALLKILEEPPAQTLLILITHQPDKLLPTTRSRCREVKLSPPTVAQVVEILQAQKVSITPEQQDWLSKLVPPSAGQWLRYVEHEADTLYAQWLEVLTDPSTGTLLPFVTKQAKLESEVWQLSCDLFLCALHRLVLSAQQPVELLPQEQSVFPQLLSRAPVSHWQELWHSAVEWLPLTVQSNYDKKQVLQTLLFQAANTPKKAA